MLSQPIVVHRLLVDFLRAFGGDTIVQAAWGQAGCSPALPPCPALTGAEPEPVAALQVLLSCATASAQQQALQDAATARGSPTWTRVNGTPHAEPHQGTATDHVIQTEPAPAASAAAHQEVPLPSAETLPESEKGQLNMSQRGENDGVTACDDAHDAEAACCQKEDGAASRTGMLVEMWRLLSPAAEAITEQQMSCLVQGMRLLVTLLRDNHTWQPVCPVPLACLLHLVLCCNVLRCDAKRCAVLCCAVTQCAAQIQAAVVP